MSTLWIVNGSLEAVAGIRRARELGHHVVVSDLDPGAPGLEEADEGVVASIMDVEQTLAAVSRFHRDERPVDGIMCIAADVPLTVASVAEELGLYGIPPRVARLSMDKLAMKEKFAADGVDVPWFSPVDSAQHLERLVREQGLPLVIKPVDSRGSRGVLRLTPGADTDRAFEIARGHSPTGRVMVERFVEGPQISTETVMVDGVAHTPGFSDRNYEHLERYAPYIIENGGDLPSALPAAAQREILELVQQAALSLGVVTGVVKGDLVWDEASQRPLVIELAARLSGGYFCTHQIPLSTGVDLVQAAIRISLGQPVDAGALRPRRRRPVARRDIFPRPGRVVAVTGAERARQVQGVEEVVIGVRRGDTVAPPTDSNGAAGAVIATGETRPAARAAALRAIELIHVETEP